MSQDLPSPGLSKSTLAAAGVAGAGALSLGAAGFAELIPADKLLELGMGGAAIVGLLFVVTRFLSHLKSEGTANRTENAATRTTLDMLGKSFTVFADRVEDKIDDHAREMRSILDRPAPVPTSRGGRTPHLHVIRPDDPELPSTTMGVAS